MRYVLLTSTLLFCIPNVQAADKVTADKIIKNAVKAIGGKKAIEKSKVSQAKDSGTYYGMGDGIPYEGVYSYQLPDKSRMEIMNVFTIVVNGDKGWTSMMGETKEMSKKMIEAQRKELHVQGVSLLLPFINRKGYKFTSLGNIKVNGVDTVGLKVSKEGQDDVTLYFDVKTFLLTKMSYTAYPQENEFKAVAHDVYFSAHKKFDGVMVATKAELKQDGKRFLEMKITEWKAMPKLDPKTFSKP